MYVCMYVCMYLCMYVCTYVRTYACMYVRTYVRTYVRMYGYVWMYVCVYVCMDGWMDGWMDICTYRYVHTYIRMHVCMCMYVCMCAHMFANWPHLCIGACLCSSHRCRGQPRPLADCGHRPGVRRRRPATAQSAPAASAYPPLPGTLIKRDICIMSVNMALKGDNGTWTTEFCFKSQRQSSPRL